MDSQHTGQGQSDEADGTASGEDREGKPGRRKNRRVSTRAVPGSDPSPQPEPRRHADNENDDRLKADKPPHWG